MNEEEIEKVRRKIPNWFNRPTQINSKILLNYLRLSNCNREQVKKENLENSCIDIQDFNGNYQQMKNSGENNHAQVFYEESGYITLQNDVKDFIIEKYTKMNDPLKQIIKIFIDKWDNTDSLWRMEFIENLPRTYRGYKLSISFGQGNRQVPPKYPYISFLKDNNIVSNGVYPYIKYNYEDNTIYTSINYSNDNKPNYSDDILKKIEDYEEFYFQKNDIDSLVKQINININEFEKIINNYKSDNKTISNLRIKNIILYGSPGIGKTHNYKRLISLIETKQKNEKEIFKIITNNSDTKKDEALNFPNERVKFITFHQSYSYEDFIEGFRPQKDGTIKLEDGIFKIICDEASKDNTQNYYLVIDEINRGNISKIFGELITLIEEDKRDNLEVVLPYSKKPFKIPNNLYIIATMNSTDKSIATVDIALRRRFSFIKMKPNPELVKYTSANEFMQKVNKYIERNLNEDYLIGHSYFMNIQNEDDLEFIKEYKIKPLLEEYFYAESKSADNILKEIITYE